MIEPRYERWHRAALAAAAGGAPPLFAPSRRVVEAGQPELGGESVEQRRARLARLFSEAVRSELPLVDLQRQGSEDDRQRAQLPLEVAEALLERGVRLRHGAIVSWPELERNGA